MNFNLIKFLSISILLITISSINQWSYLPIGNTFFWWGIYACILITFIKSRKIYYDKNNDRYIYVLKLYLAWNIISIIRGVFIADNYWEWKNLIGTGMVLLLPLSIYITTNKNIVQTILANWIIFALPAFFLFLPSFKYADAVGRYLVPISFLLLCFPLLTNRWKIITIIFSLFVLLGDLSARSNVLKFGVPLILSSLYYVRFFLPTKLFEVVRIIMMLVPIILFILGLSGTFNVFKMNEYITGDYTTQSIKNGKISEENLTSDTRTFLYEEVISSAIKFDYILFGRSPARGNESLSFGMYSLETLHTGKMERFSNEVSILNVFTWTGIIGVTLYFLIFYHASYLAINKSNNTFLQIVGLCVSFRWIFAWIEDFSEFDLSYFFLWTMIGLCFSKSFREMNNKEIKYWVLGIFDKKYRKLTYKSKISNLTTNGETNSSTSYLS